MPATTETNTKPSYTNGPFCLTEEDGELLIVAPDPELPGCYGLLAQILDCVVMAAATRVTQAS